MSPSEALRTEGVSSTLVWKVWMDTRNFEYLFYGFLAVWLIVVAYVVTLVAREGRLKRELEQVKGMLEDRQKR